MILLTGGTGSLGSKVLEGLVARQYPLRVFTRGRSDWRDVSVPSIRQMGAEAFLGDLRNPKQVKQAVQGCNVVIHIAGMMRARPEQTFQEIHVDALQTLVEEAQSQGVQRFIYVSCLGASPHSLSEYFRTKSIGEDVVVAGQFYWTIFRPSFMFGRKFSLLDLFMSLVKKLPVMPVIGGGVNEVQPISVDDVAACVVQSVYAQDTAYKIYDLAGPRVYTLAELLEMVNETLIKPKPVVSINTDWCLMAVRLLSKIYPSGPFNEDLIHLLTSDSTASPELMQETFKVRMNSLEDSLHRLVDRS